MNPVLASLPGPQLFWKHFEFCLRTPRESTKTTFISNKVAEIARGWGYFVAVDDAGNVLVRKPATAGLENRPYVCLQAHLDMVCEKESTSTHDFSKDPIVPRIVGNKLMATGTTLGADNGVGVALCLMILDPAMEGLRHGPLEVLLTVDEEIGLVGAMKLPAGFLLSRRLINLDSEEDWRVCIGCAGGVDAHLSMDLPMAASAGAHTDALTVHLSGCHGGHSGCAVHEGHANAIHALARTLLQVHDHRASLGCRANGPTDACLLAGVALDAAPFELLGLVGGTKRNAIPVACAAKLAVLPEGHAHRAAVIDAIKQSYGVVAAEYRSLEPHMQLRIFDKDGRLLASAGPTDGGALSTAAAPAVPALPCALTSEGTKRFLRGLLAMPHGVLRMSPDVKGLVETSINLAKVSMPVEGQPQGKVEFLARSSSNSQQGLVYDQLAALTALLDTPQHAARLSAPINWHNGWLPNPHSALLAHAKRAFHDVHHKDIEVYAIHAGLECGVIGEKYAQMESISIGPTVEAVHTPAEALDIPSVAPFCTFLLRLLDQLD